MYHQVTPTPVPASFYKYTVTPRAFRIQMDLLARLGYTPITLDALVAARRGSSQLPPRPVIITFDDGFRDCATYAVPILNEHRFTATFFLVAGLMGQASNWLVAERGVEFEMMDWATARELVAAGFDCGSHTVTHPRLAQISERRCREELGESRRCLEDNLGHTVRHLAYPYGSFNERVSALAAEAGYVTACSVQIGLATMSESPLALHRVPITGQESDESWRSRLDLLFRLKTGWGLNAWLDGKKQALVRRANLVARQGQG